MRKSMLMAAMIVFSLVSSSNAIADKIVVMQKEENVWEMRNGEGDYVGLLKKTEFGSYALYNKKEEYMGTILTSGVLQPKYHNRKTTKITREQAQLYLDALEAIDTLSEKPTSR